MVNKENKLNPFVRIRGVKGRGREVIAELVKRGGTNALRLSGEAPAFYYINPSGVIDRDIRPSMFVMNHYEELTLPKKKSSSSQYKWLAIYESSYSTETGLLSISGYLSTEKPEGSKADGYKIAKITWVKK